MDNRHQSEREYIRYHAATSGEHLVAGIHGLAHGKSPAVGCRRVALLPQSLRDACSAIRLPAGKRELTAVSILAWHCGAGSHPSSLILFPLQLLPPVRTLHSFSKCAHGHSFLRSGFCSQGVTRCKQQNPFLEYGSAASRLVLRLLS